MKVQLRGREYVIKFKHEEPYHPSPNKLGIQKLLIPFHGGTSCFLYEDGQQVSRVDLTVYHTDKFDRIIGRKIALDRIIKKFGFNRDERKEIWATYLQTHKV